MCILSKIEEHELSIYRTSVFTSASQKILTNLYMPELHFETLRHSNWYKFVDMILSNWYKFVEMILEVQWGTLSNISLYLTIGALQQKTVPFPTIDFQHA